MEYSDRQEKLKVKFDVPAGGLCHLLESAHTLLDGHLSDLDVASRHHGSCSGIVDLDIGLLDDEEEELAIGLRWCTCQPLIFHCVQQALLFQVMPDILFLIC